MGFYDDYILPHVVDLSCGSKPVRKQRAKVVPLARGRVLEVGMGSGLNLPFYDPERVELVWGLEPSEGMRHKARKNLARTPLEVRWLGLSGEEIPLEDSCADTVVMTYTLCSIADCETALAQMRRVLKPTGELLFIEHGAAPDPAVRRWQRRINPIWSRLSGGCNLHRRIPELLETAGFQVRALETMYLPGTPRITGFNYWGRAGRG